MAQPSAQLKHSVTIDGFRFEATVEKEHGPVLHVADSGDAGAVQIPLLGIEGRDGTGTPVLLCPVLSHIQRWQGGEAVGAPRWVMGIDSNAVALPGLSDAGALRLADEFGLRFDPHAQARLGAEGRGFETSAARTALLRQAADAPELITELGLAQWQLAAMRVGQLVEWAATRVRLALGLDEGLPVRGFAELFETEAALQFEDEEPALLS